MLFRSGNWFLLLSNRHFQTFYAAYEAELTYLRDNDCRVQYANYQHWIWGNDTYLDNLAALYPGNISISKPAACSEDLNHLGWGLRPKDCSGYELVICLLGAVPETAKADMQAAGLVLGLMPVILAMASSTTAETALLALRRPLLAAILGLASPAIDPIRTFAYSDSLHVLQRRTSFNKMPSFFTQRPRLLSAIQYLVATMALTNLVFVTKDLTQKTTMGNDPNRDYQVTVWALWAFAIHVFGTCTFMLRFRLQSQPDTKTLINKPGWRTRIWEHCRYEHIPCNRMPDKSSIAARSGTKKAYLFFVLSWAVSISTIVHIVYGTLSFSNMLWMSGGDALLVLLRCLGSVAVCRMVLMYEIYEMSRKTTIEPEAPERDGAVLPYHESSQGLLQEYKVPESVVVPVTHSSDQSSLREYTPLDIAVPDTSYSRLTS